MSATAPAKMTPEEKEAFHQAAEARIKTFGYAPPPRSQWNKDVVQLVKSPLLKVNMHVVREGGENNLHYHTNSDTTWMVLKGRARFYGVGDALLGELGANEGILLPGGSRYWFENAGPTDLELLQMVAVDRSGQGADQRIDVAANPNADRLARNSSG